MPLYSSFRKICRTLIILKESTVLQKIATDFWFCKKTSMADRIKNMLTNLEVREKSLLFVNQSVRASLYNRFLKTGRVKLMK